MKGPARNSHRLVQQTHEILVEGPPTIIVPGNHDLSHDRLESLDSQPLGALGRMRNMTVLIGAHPTLPVFSIPYLQDWKELSDHIERYREAHDGQEWIVGMHAPIFPPGKEPPYDYLPSEELAPAFEGVKTWIAYGHIHDPHGVYQPIPDGPRFANIGAISRGSLHAETLKRKPQVYVLDTDSGEYEILDVPHLPSEEVFAMHSVVKKAEASANMVEFLRDLDSSSVDQTSIEAVRQHAQDAGLDEDVLGVVMELLEDATAKG